MPAATDPAILDPNDPVADAASAARLDQMHLHGRAPHPLSPLGKALRDAWMRNEARKAGASPKKLDRLIKSQMQPINGVLDGRGDIAGARGDAVVDAALGREPRTKRPGDAGAFGDAPQVRSSDDDVAKARQSFDESRRRLAAFEQMRNPASRAALVAKDAAEAKKAAKKGYVEATNTGRLAKSAAVAEVTDLITELEFLDPDRVDAVSSPANGTPFLVLKGLAGT